ncbi:MAG: PBS lyase [Deltaproteobacteria bacterium]|nr:PBS lyase [Deltaproteobacteria bacterium]
MEGRFLGKEIIIKPACPFCGVIIEKPGELSARMPTEMPVGICCCGAVYAFDVTGHNLGAAMVEALVVACNGDWDLAFDLLPDEDYQEKQLDHYDMESHMIIPGGAYEGRQINGTLYFIRPHEDIREVTEEGTRRLIERATPVSSAGSISRKREKKSFSKKKVEDMVRDYQIDEILSLAQKDQRIIRDLQRLLYSVDPLIRNRAAEVMGKVFAIIAKKDPGIISRRLQGLFTAITDTAASSWGYIRAIGEIISNNPRQFAGYTPELYRLMGDRALLPDVLEALGKIAGKKSDIIRKHTLHFIPFLQDGSPEIRGFTTILLGNMKAIETKDDISKLKEDTSVISVYRRGIIEELSVGHLALEALDRL